MKPPASRKQLTKKSAGPQVVAAPRVAQVLEIEKPIYGGNFLARQDGKALFVPLVLPGEQARVHVVEDKAKRGYALAELDRIIAPSPERIAPGCPHFGPCGGCNYQHTGYANQLAIKESVLRETMERAGVSLPPTLDILSADPWSYRNRIRLAFDAGGNPGYRARRSNAIVPIRECPIAAPLLVRAALAAADVLARVPANLRPQEVALFCNADESALLATFFVADNSKLRLDPIAQALHERIPQLQSVEAASGGRPGHPPLTLARWGTPSLLYRAAGFDYRVDHGAFFQVNRWLVDALLQRVTANRSGSLAWDLFAGVGLFARQLTASFEKVVAVEAAPSSTAALAANLAGAGGEAVAGSTFEFLQNNTHGSRPDLIVVDPPRTGLEAATTTLLNQIAAPSMVYVSCDPATLARDLRALLAGSYSIASVALADLFPQTFHLETVVHLRRA